MRLGFLPSLKIPLGLWLSAQTPTEIIIVWGGRRRKGSKIKSGLTLSAAAINTKVGLTIRGEHTEEELTISVHSLVKLGFHSEG